MMHESRRALAATRSVLLSRTPLRDGHRARSLGVRERSRRQSGNYEVPTWTINGMDVLAVRDRGSPRRRRDSHQ